MTKFTRVSDDELRDNGFDPQWISDEDDEGPYAVYRDFNGICLCCHHKATEWGVVDLSTATADGQTWNSDEGQTNAYEHARMLNGAWLRGYANAIAKAEAE